MAGCATNQSQPPATHAQSPAPPIYPTPLPYAAVFPRAAVAADHYIASQAGAEILKKGGNAVDAAVATSFTLSVVRPMSCGIGGGGFMVIKFNNDPKHGNLATALNYRETTPAAIHPTFYEEQNDKNASTVGGKAVAIPGTVRGLLFALEKYGTLDRATVLAPAIRAAEEGYEVDQFEFDGAKKRIKWFNEDESRKRRFAFVWKRFLREGDVAIGDRITNPEQAAALKLIARDGADAFYRGEIALAIVNMARNDGGVITSQDLAAYEPREVEPLSSKSFGRRLIGMPPPSSGGIAVAEIAMTYNHSAAVWESALMLQAVLGNVVSERRRAELVMADIDPEIWRSLDARSTIGSNIRGHSLRHALVESMKHAFADRARWLADPAFADVPTQALLSRDYARARAKKIDENKTLQTDEYGSTSLPPPDDSGTSHLCVIDPQGNAVACTETINLSYGSKLAVEEFGFCLNNEMDDFTTRRGVANDFGLVQSDRNMPQPGKRPLSSMSPTIVLDQNGEVFMIAGASGGPRIITGTVQAMLKVLLEDASAGTAVAAPRIHHQWLPDVLEYEKGALDQATIDELKKKGHQLAPAKEDVGNVQLIRRSRDKRGWDAACDPRKGGRPAGF
jgi:gamma-glutamyltranspeptidase/glutathione hydrolase